ncbi:protein FAR1-RELATED SEQUENCE 5-like [Lotus japonicus]|uniref:protein FAR1-RELATED SEQUENCE 5-like n=1 Tax=Lotus japonicus TaxID=34305 RepID=UPI00258F9AAF|nr:protein FAR1-RELATED SEQUENCE 5-like [Lotus japonicus]
MLCGWHLLRNATSNVHNLLFTSLFGKCMFGDYDISQFQRKWGEMVEKCGVEDNIWVKDLYNRRQMWAAAHIRGNFFASVRTTSHVKGLHANVGRFINFNNNLVEFVQHYQRCIDLMRFKEVCADFESSHGEHSLEMPLRLIERLASKIDTTNIFFKVRTVLRKALTTRVVVFKQNLICTIYSVSKYRCSDYRWLVVVSSSMSEIKCSCLRMESNGIPCEHLLAVIAFLDMDEIPKCLVLERWTKDAKVSCEGLQNGVVDSLIACRYEALRERCRCMCKLASRSLAQFEETNSLIMSHSNKLELVDNGGVNQDENNVDECLDGDVRDPKMVRSKGFSKDASQRGGRAKRVVHCGRCGRVGLNRLTCDSMRDNVSY